MSQIWKRVARSSQKEMRQTERVRISKKEARRENVCWRRREYCAVRISLMYSPVRGSIHGYLHLHTEPRCGDSSCFLPPQIRSASRVDFLPMTTFVLSASFFLSCTLLPPCQLRSVQGSLLLMKCAPT